jgi:uncharacterized protein DUF5995
VVALALPAAAAAEDAPFINWNPLLPGFPLGYHPSTAAECRDGSNTCIEHTLAEMYRRFDARYPSCDNNAVFGLVYIRVTESIRKAVARGFYEEPKFLNHEDAVFAHMYFRATDAWRRGDLANVPPAWRDAFDAARDRSVSGLGNLLMSMNAHVNRDMPFMLAALGLTKPDGSSRKPDHDRGNAVLSPLYDDVLAEVARRWDPGTTKYDVPGTTGDDAGLFQLLQVWREQVWRNAELLTLAKGKAQKQNVGNMIEQYALGSARTIKANTKIASSAARDAHCAEYLRTHRERGALAKPVIRKHRLRARHGRVRVRLACPAGLRWCDGTVVLERRRRGRPTRMLVQRAFPAIGPGRRATVRMRLPRSARRALRRRRLPVRARVQTTTPWGLPVTAGKRARLRRVRR